MTGIQRENIERATVALKEARSRREQAHARHKQAVMDEDVAAKELRAVEGELFILSRSWLRACNAVLDRTV